MFENLSQLQICQKMALICQRMADQSLPGIEQERLQGVADQFSNEAKTLTAMAGEL